MVIRTLVVMCCCMALLGCGSSKPKAPTEAELKAMNDKMGADMAKMTGQLSQKLPTTKKAAEPQK